MRRAIFTLTAGRTGTAWLAEFLGRNLGVAAIHEPLGIHDFGVTMPDIRLMRCFNTHGNDGYVQAFWEAKLAQVPGPTYVETNHSLGKCGLVENLAVSDLADDAVVVVLRRDLVRQTVSYIIRSDFVNMTVPWQWYLVPQYPLKLVPFEPFEQMGAVGLALWYSYEMAARQSYYIQRFGDRLRFVEADLDRIVTVEGAAQVWAELGGQGDCILPPPRNASTGAPPEQIVAQVRSVVSRITFDADEVARARIRQGFSFESDQPAPDLARGRAGS